MFYIYMAGTDCDHSSWERMYKFDSQAEADEFVDGMYESADGPMGHHIATKAEYDEFYDGFNHCE